MNRVTIIDIAAKAKVSPATVDRALNGRVGVSAPNRHRVLRAARDLGYLPTEGSVAMPSRPVALQFLIPNIENAFMRELANSIEQFVEKQPLVKSCKISVLKSIGSTEFINALDGLSLETDGLGIIATDHPKTREAIRQVCEAGVRVVTLASDVSSTPRSAYVGVNNRVAGRTAAQIMAMQIKDCSGTIAVFCGSRAFHGHQEREAGFVSYMAEHEPELKALSSIETDELSHRLRTEMASLLRSESKLVGIYCVGAGRKGIIEALKGQIPRPVVVMHDLNKNSRAWLMNNKIDAVIDQNARLVGERAVINLLGAIASGPKKLSFQHIEPRIILRENIPVER